MSIENTQKLQDKNYWMLLCNPNKWFGDKHVKNAAVNNLLVNLDEFAWTTGRSLFSDVKEGDLGIIKVGNDHRSIACRTKDAVEYDKLHSGIYTIVEFIEKEGTVVHYDKDGIRRVHFKVIRNLYKENNIIDKKNTEILLQKNYKSFSSKKITKDIFLSIEDYLN